MSWSLTGLDCTPSLRVNGSCSGYLAQGLTYAEIARTLVISEKTVSSHVSNLLRKTGTASRVELIRLLRRSGD
jgi:DNA-binding CsgD family transcriptional regulator